MAEKSPDNTDIDWQEIRKTLAEAQQCYENGYYESASLIAEHLCSRLERKHEDSVEYSEAMRIMGMIAYRQGDLPLAEFALTCAYNIRNKTEFSEDEVAKEILVALSEVCILRGDPLRIQEILEVLQEFPK